MRAKIKWMILEHCVKRLPMFDPAWPDDTQALWQDVWWQLFNAIIEQGEPEVPPQTAERGKDSETWI